MSGLTIEAHEMLETVNRANAVIVGSGSLTRNIMNDGTIIKQIHLDPYYQIIGAQRHGTLIFAKLGILNRVPACKDSLNKPWYK